MKLLKLLFAFIMIVSFASCGNDDDADPLLDSDNDGIVDINDLCPNTPGTVIDQGCYLFTNINISSSPYEVYFIESTEVQTTNVNGLDIVTTISTIGDTFQLEMTFSENNTYIMDGVYRESSVVVVQGEVQDENSEIIVFDQEPGAYVATDSPMTLVLDGETYEVSSFSQTEIILMLEETWTEEGDTFVLNEQIRLRR